MDAARAAVQKITQRTGHTTDVDEVVNPAVISETIKPHRHEQTQEAIDREVHQDHYHTTVQPIQHREVAPEKHVHNIAPQIEREFKHDNEGETRRRVEAELRQFENTSRVAQTTTSREVAPAVAGEHVHHHVHETVQPIIHKETIQPEVIHTTVPIHETHIAGAQHHGLSALPMKTLDEFTRAGGVIDGQRHHTHEEYDGAPRPYNEKLTTTLEKVLPGHSTGTTSGMGRDHHSSGMGGAGLGAAGMGAAGAGAAGLGSTHRDHRSSGLGTTGRTRRGSGSSSSSSDEEKRRRKASGTTGTRGTTGSSGTAGKPSLMDKLNPNVDSNNDGKPGFMK